MSELRVAFFGDVVGEPGRRAFAHAAMVVRERFKADVVVVNGENARHGSGLHPAGYEELRAAGADAVTLGDHAMDEEKTYPLIRDPDEPLLRPANIAEANKAIRDSSTYLRLKKRSGAPTTVFVTTVSGRVHMKYGASEPFDAIDAQVGLIAAEHPDALVILEFHCEATSEKNAAAWYAREKHAGRIVAVVGTHTHVPTADARVHKGVASITDLGMCGGHLGVIGFDPELAHRRLVRQASGKTGGAIEPTDRGLAATGVLITIDTAARVAAGIEPLRIETPG